jgi:GT2 family glycosyltransferase
MDLSVIIVNYNVKYFLEQCLYSVQKAAGKMETEILVVDNNSTDGSREYLLPRFPAVNFIWNSDNAGFAKANNQALAFAKGKYVLFLNPDTIIPEDCFEGCLEYFRSNINIGALGVHMIDGSGEFLKESKRSFPSPLTSLYKLTGLARLFPHSARFAKYYLGNLPENQDHAVDVLTGAFLMVPREILHITGGFDESFFMYGEDVDLSYRIQKAGFRNIYYADCTIIHFKGESTGKDSLKYVGLFYKAMSIFVKKHYGRNRAGTYTFFLQLAIWGRAAFSALSRILQQTGRLLKKGATKKEEHEPARTIIVSEESDFDFIKRIVINAAHSGSVLGRVYNDPVATGRTMGGIDQLPELVKKHNVDQIIFCANGLGYKEIISIIQRLPGEVRNKFHAAGSTSIVGSYNKDQHGEYAAADNN